MIFETSNSLKKKLFAVTKQIFYGVCKCSKQGQSRIFALPKSANANDLIRSWRY